MIRKTKEQSVNLILPAGTPAGVHTVETITLDSSFDKATGVNIVINENGSVPYFRMSLSDTDGNTHTDMLNAKTYEYAPEREYKAVDIPGESRVLVKVEVPGALADDLNFEIAFRLQKQ